MTGIILIVGGVWGICYTYTNIARENIVTPKDAVIPEKPVRGPLTLKAQADVIRQHTLKMTDGKTYAEMPRQIPKLDEKGKEIVDTEGKPVMAANTSRDTWITAMTLTTAINLGILTYAFSAMVILFGCVSILTGVIFYFFSKK